MEVGKWTCVTVVLGRTWLCEHVAESSSTLWVFHEFPGVNKDGWTRVLDLRPLFLKSPFDEGSQQRAMQWFSSLPGAKFKVE